MLVEDRRVGADRPVYTYTQGSALVQVPDVIRKCVGFVMYRADDGLHYAGTAFFVSESLPDTDQHVTWLVTAAHVINGVAAKSVDQIVRLRMNLKEGGSAYADLPVGIWTKHLTDDVAVTSFPVPDAYDYRQWGLYPKGIVSPEVIAQRAIGVGDEVFLTGIFVNHPGTEQNIPIVRTGNIAAMPAEAIRSKTWGKVRGAYLVEARSIGGLSGAPVFVYTGFSRRGPDGALQFGGGEPMYYLLGLMHGHFPGELSEADIEDPNSKEQINIGIAVVVPVSSLIETINQPRFVMKKDEIRKARLDELAAAPDESGAVADEAAQMGLESREAFDAALRKVSRRKPSPPDEGTSGT